MVDICGRSRGTGPPRHELLECFCCRSDFPEPGFFDMRFLFLGTPVSSSNRGVLALGSSLVGLARQADPAAEIGLLIGHHRNESIPYRVGESIIQVPVLPCRLSPRSRLRDHLVWIALVAVIYRLAPFGWGRPKIARLAPWVEALHRADFVGDIRGGDSFSDIYGFRRFFYGFTLAAIVLLVKGRIAQMPQTYGPYAGRTARAMARFLLLRSSVIYARDRASREVALGLVGDRKEVLLSPDVAFSLSPILPRNLRLEPLLPNATREGVIGININGLMYSGGYTRKNMFGLKLLYPIFLPRLIAALLESSASEIWLIPHTFAKTGSPESDPEASRLVRAALPINLQARVRMAVGDYDQHEIKAVIGKCDFFVGSRMHACIAALSQGIPCVGVAYSMKFAGVFESVGMEEWIVDGRDTEEDAAIARIVNLYGRRDEVRTSLRLRADAARSQLKEVFASLLSPSANDA